MSGGGTTTSTTQLPAGVENLMNSSAARLGGVQSLSDIAQFLGPNPQQFAPRSGWEADADYWYKAMSWRPPTETQLWGNLGVVPTQVGQTPGAFGTATSLRPAASEQSLQNLFGLQQTAGEISGQYYARPQQFNDAYTNAFYAPTQATTGINAFMPVQQLAGSVPRDFRDLDLRMLLENQFLAPTGINIQASPSYAAANQAFRTAILPEIENTAAVAGLGRSTALTNATAQAQAAYLLPVIEGELEREFTANQLRYGTVRDIGLERARASERGIERSADVGLQQALATQQLPQILLASAQMLTQLGQQDAAHVLNIAQAEERGTVRRVQAIETAINTLQAQGQQDLARQLEMATADERALSRYAESQMASYDPLLQLGQTENARIQQSYQGALDLGALDRERANERYAAQYNDYLRQQALSEEALFTPFGQLIPSALGSRVGQSGGGLFK